MVKKSKLIYVIGSAVIGVVTLLIVFFVLIACGVINTRQNKLVFTSASNSSFVYDGRAHTFRSWELSEGELHEGHTAVVTVSGSQTEAGSSTNYLSAVIVDEAGADVTNHYEIEYQPGTLTVLPREISVISSYAEKVYDGTPLTSGGWEITEGELLASHELKPQFSGSITGVGSAVNYYTAHVFNDKGREVTSNYLINYSYGVLNVTPRAITLASYDGKKVYDGTPLTSGEWSITEGELAEGQKCEVEVSGTITGAGKAVNTFTAVIKDANGADVTNNYEITKTEGELEVEKRKVTITSAGDKKEYDNSALTNDGWEITEGNFIEGHVCGVTVMGSRTDAGISENTFSVSVTDADGNDVSENYEIIRVAGELEVTKREVTITSESASAVYNGESFSHYGYRITSGSLAEGHTEKVTISAEITQAGTCENTITLVEVFDGETNVTENYSFNYDHGELTVRKRTIVLQAGSDFKMYDDTPLVCYEWAYGSELKILDNHKISVPMNSYRIEVGIGANRIESSQVEITDEGDNDVTENYEVITADGDLYVTPRRITIRSNSASKIYDGTPLTCNGENDYEVVSITQPVEGHSLNVRITGQRIEVGSSFNTIAEVIVRNSEGRDVTFNYEINKQELELVVKADDQSSSGNGGGLDDSGSIGGSGGDGKGTLAVKVTSQTGDKIYLRYKSFGGYNGKGWNGADSYSGTLTFNGGNYSYNYLTSVALSERQSASAKIELFTGNYLLPYYTLLGASGYEIQQSDVTYSGDTTQTYQVVYSTYDYLKYGKINNRLGEYSVQEQIYRDFVYRNYLEVPDSTRAALADIAAQFNRDDKLIANIAGYVSTAAEYNLDYPKALDSEQDIAVGFLTKYKQGICGHYASAATILYRMLGVPARYVIGYTGTTKAGETVEITSNDAHAWVEVYIDGMGWVNIEVTGGGNSDGGSGDGDKTDYRNEIMPVREFYKFDNYEHSHSGKLQGLSEFEARGFTYTAVVSGYGKAVGLYECEITDFRLFDPDGIDVTDRYNLTFAKGTLQIYVFELTVTTGGAQKIYDGKELTSDDIKIEGRPMGSHRVVLLEASGSRTNVGTSINGYNLKIVGADGNDETYYYKINAEYGNLTVTARELTFTAESKEIVFNPSDRQPLIAENYEMTGELAEGHRAEVTVTGSQTGIGSSTSRVSVKIYDKDGVDVTSNYAITTVTGTLTVKLPQQ